MGMKRSWSVDSPCRYRSQDQTGRDRLSHGNWNGGKSTHCAGLSSNNTIPDRRCDQLTPGRLSDGMPAILGIWGSPGQGLVIDTAQATTRHERQAHSAGSGEIGNLLPTGDRPMTITTTIRTAAFTLMMGAGFATAAAAGGNSVVIEQWGAGNAVGGAQSGHGQRLSVYQDGWSNTSINTQDGNHNRTVVGQRGHRNTVDTDQRGSDNIAGVAQFGGHNDAEVDQRGRRNAVGVIQAGHGNSAQSTQRGNGNVAVIVQD
ncbi:MAG: hypothetical protein FH759_10195 [Sediminimonas qiaohouensis]|uniref:Curlin n=2 Tax=Roseobacteraceae TaxID=2854170 RepID=A0A7C9HCL7_9RHOB|nr:hypothetical protein [Sediminimonas qiaohouensis]